jgi:hypothetical protein
MAGEVTNFELLLTRGRALGISFLIVEQVPSEISRAARVSTHLVAAFCTSGTELRAAADLLGLRDPRQIEPLQSLAKGECIVTLTGDRCPTPLLVRTPKVTFDRRNLTQEEREFYMNRSFADLLPKVQPRYAGFIEQRQTGKRVERDPNRLSPSAWRVFVRIAGNVEDIESRMAVLGMNRGEEEVARKECMTKSYVTKAGSLGRGITYFGLTPKGRAYAEEHSVPILTHKSGVVHEALLRHVKANVSAACPSVRWLSSAGATGPVQPDAYGVFRSGRAICVQIHCHNRTDYEVRRLMDLCAINHVDMVLLVAATKKAAEALSLTINKTWRQEVPQRFVLLSATECLAAFDWVSLLERPV